VKTKQPLTELLLKDYTDCYKGWLSSFDRSVSHLINMDIETTGIVSKKLVKKMIDLQLLIQKEGFGSK